MDEEKSNLKIDDLKHITIPLEPPTHNGFMSVYLFTLSECSKSL